MNNIFLKDKENINQRFPAIYLMTAILFGILFLKLINLQIVEGNENLFLSSTIKTSKVIIRAPRGLIYDRNNNLLVVNKPSFKLVLDLSQLPCEREKDVIFVLSQILGVQEEDLWNDFINRVYKEDDKRISISQITLLNNISRDQMVSISSRSEELPGIFVEISTTREYVGGEMFAHIVGYVREISVSELISSDYSVGDVIGSVGLEQYYDSTLRGVNGKRIVETDRDDITVRELIPVEALPGESIQVSIDSKMQEKMVEVLESGIEKNNADGGAAVIVDVTNGEVLSLVSLPAYNPNDIVKGLSLNEYLKLSEDLSLPLYNRVVSMAQPPGSTFKTIVASAALQEGVINSSTIFESKGCMELSEGYEFCEVGKASLGKLTIYQGLARSSNVYFCNTMLGLGINNLNKYTDDFGLGQNTGIDLPSEQPGVVSSKEVKEVLQGEQWYFGDSCNTAIGQGLMKVTPIQMVSWVSAIANGGKVYKPHLVVAVMNEEGQIKEKIESEVIHTLPIDSSNLDIVKEGMYLVVNDPWGSGFSLRGIKSDPAAKTGSAEAYRKVNGRYEKQGHSWVSGFFPYGNPRYAFVVYLEFGGWGFRSAEVMRDFFEWYDTEYQMQ